MVDAGSRQTETMFVSRPFAALVLLAAAISILGCSRQNGRADSDASAAASATEIVASATSVASPVTGTQFGSAGLVPRYFPNSEDSDWVAMYEGAPEVGPLIGVYGDWRDDSTTPGAVPTVFRAGFAAA